MVFSKSFVQYANELNKIEYAPLSREEEKELLLKSSLGDVKSREKIIKSHLRFVVYLLRDFKIPQQVDPMDLVQEGNAGLLEGVSRFDVSQNFRVSTYVQYYIRWYIGRALESYSKTASFYSVQEDFDFDEVESDTTVEEEVNTDILSYISTFLTDKEMKIISLLLGLEYPFKKVTLRDAGSLLHLDAERIRQIKKEALEKIKNNPRIVNKLR